MTNNQNDKQWNFREDERSAALYQGPRAPAPPGFIQGTIQSKSTHSNKDTGDKSDKIYQSAMATGTGPAKQIFMTALMLWMSGSSITIFTIMMVGMSVYQPIQALLGVGKVFERYEGTDVNIIVPKMAFCGIQCVVLGMAMYKLNTLGLLPSLTSDPEAWAHVKQAVEYSTGSISF
eukprot:249380_1